MSDASKKDRSDTEEEVIKVHSDSVQTGHERLNRSWRVLLVTGFVGGVEVGFGTLAMLYTHHVTDSHLLAGLAFSVGFIALLLAHSELFTEGFFYPLMAVYNKAGTVPQMLRLWAFTFLTNLAGGAVIMFFISRAFPELEGVFAKSAHHFLEVPLGWQGVSLAFLAGGAITLMTRMQGSGGGAPASIVAAVVGAFLLAGLQLFHSVLDSIIIFGAMMYGVEGVTFGAWFGWVWYVVIFNVLGGIVLVTTPRAIRAADVEGHTAPHLIPHEDEE